jgi:hypothetical protein
VLVGGGRGLDLGVGVVAAAESRKPHRDMCVECRYD